MKNVVEPFVSSVLGLAFLSRDRVLGKASSVLSPGAVE
jgi:hypothetical protein